MVHVEDGPKHKFEPHSAVDSASLESWLEPPPLPLFKARESRAEPLMVPGSSLSRIIILGLLGESSHVVVIITEMISRGS